MLQVWLACLRLLGREEGQDLVEYGLLMVLIAVVAIVGITALGGRIQGFFEQIVAQYPGAG